MDAFYCLQCVFFFCSVRFIFACAAHTSNTNIKMMISKPGKSTNWQRYGKNLIFKMDFCLVCFFKCHFFSFTFFERVLMVAESTSIRIIVIWFKWIEISRKIFGMKRIKWPIVSNFLCISIGQLMYGKCQYKPQSNKETIASFFRLYFFFVKLVNIYTFVLW